MEITLGQQYNVGETPTVILYIYINRHAEAQEKQLLLLFKSLSRTVTCAGELSPLTCVIPRGKGLIAPLSRLSYMVLYTLIQLSPLSLYLVSVRYSVFYVLDAHDE